ncbi:MAG: hypothetical protein J0G36_16460 [Afipia sp.]|nr:hypothetical protein [Afipia sp.]
MAEDIRLTDSDPRVMELRRAEIIKECLRQSESCLYTSTMLFAWLRRVRIQRQLFVALPILLGGLAGVTVLKNAWPDWVIAVLALGASLFPALADALKIQTSVDELARAAAEYKVLQDRFRINANLTSLQDVDEAQRVLSDLMDRMDIVRSTSLTPPEKYFSEAQRKIDQGHYDFDVDDGPSRKNEPE